MAEKALANDEINQLKNRITELEQHNFQEYLTLLEIMSNATFFGKLKKTTCQYAEQGQCSFFTLKKEVQDKIPIVTQCRIRDCPSPLKHYHLEVSNITCTLCPNWQKNRDQPKPKAWIPQA